MQEPDIPHWANVSAGLFFMACGMFAICSARRDVRRGWVGRMNRPRFYRKDSPVRFWADVITGLVVGAGILTLGTGMAFFL